jgi:hypothetical protein
LSDSPPESGVADIRGGAGIVYPPIMEQPDLEIIVSWDPNDYALEPDDGRELQLPDRIIAAKDRTTVLDHTRRLLFVPYPVREWQFHKSDPDTWPSPLHGHHSEEPIKLDALTGYLWKIPEKKLVGRLKPSLRN